jgi:enterochelin esterase family protein
MKSILALLSLVLVTPAFPQYIPAPDVLPDGRITFRLKAPDAREVRLQFEGVPPANMLRNDQGLWTVTMPPVQPDFYGYSFVVDGVRALDLANPLMKYYPVNSESEVHVPGPPSLPWEINNVPHGVVHRHLYHSDVGGDDRAFVVYTPPNYNAASLIGYPVLYLLHGYTADASSWWTVGRANIILDNLIARGAAKPMVIVMPLGYGSMEMLRGGWTNASAPGQWQRYMRLFRSTLLDEVMPQVESSYRVSTDPKSRAIAGLSMGGAESLTVGLNALDRFAWIGGFSAGGLDTNFPAAFPKLDATANRHLRLLWISCGTEDRWLEPNRQFVHWLDAKNVHCLWTEPPGRHAWQVWRRNLASFAPLLFK